MTLKIYFVKEYEAYESSKISNSGFLSKAAAIKYAEAYVNKENFIPSQYHYISVVFFEAYQEEDGELNEELNEKFYISSSLGTQVWSNEPTE